MRVRFAQKPVVGGALWLASVTTVVAAPKVAAPMFDHAVLQRDRPVPAPVAVRYGWASNSRGNMTNTEGLPASPFRTDSWAC